VVPATDASSAGSGLVINGVYVTIQLPTTGQTIPYVPGAKGQITSVSLTK
jgi:hypothetical protein